MNRLLCWLLGCRSERKSSHRTYYNGIEDRCETVYHTWYECARCKRPLSGLGIRIRRGAEQ